MIAENTRKPQVGRFSYFIATFYQSFAIVGVGIAVMLSSTMLYILWIGFYPPGQDPSRIFFIDRLQDFKDLLEGLRNGSIQASIVNSFAIAFKNVLVDQYNQHYPKNDVPNHTPPIPSFG